ncbi:MAG: tetratricopeptide repeat protein [Terriglobia bacterium]
MVLDPSLYRAQIHLPSLRVKARIRLMQGFVKVKSRAIRLVVLLVCVASSALPALSQPQNVGATDLNRQFQGALTFYQNHRYDKARQMLTRLIRQVPDNFELNELMGLVSAAQGNNEEAGAYLAKAVRLRPESADARMYLATNLVVLHRNTQAETEFKKAAELEPNSYDANHNLGEFYIQAGKLPAAIPYLQKAAQIHPAAYNNGYDLALAEIKTGEYASAKASIQQTLRRHDAADLHSLLATADEKTGQYLQAENEYQLAAHMEPSESNIFDWGGELLLHHALEPAVQVFIHGVELFPRSPRMQIGLGIAFYSRTHYQEAIDAFCRAIDLDPADTRPYLFLGKAYDISPVQAQAVTERFRRFVHLQPRNPQALYYYALCLWKAFRTQAKPADLPEIEDLLKRSVSIDPAFPGAHLQLGVLYAQLRRYPEAIEQYGQALKLQPNLADAHYRLGEALVRIGKRDEAQQEFKTFSKLHERQIAESEKQRREIKEFVLTSRGRDMAGH